MLIDCVVFLSCNIYLHLLERRIHEKYSTKYFYSNIRVSRSPKSIRIRC